MPFTFNEEDHSYVLDGMALPSVSQILEDLGIQDNRFFKPEHAQRGKDIHALCAQYELEQEWPDSPYAGYLMSWVNFMATEGFETTAIERPNHHPSLLYAGTPDRIGMIRDAQFVVDIKTGQPAKWHQLQLLAYGAMENTKGLMDVYIKEDGTYKTKIHEYDEGLWLAMLRTYRWKNR